MALMLRGQHFTAGEGSGRLQGTIRSILWRMGSLFWRTFLLHCLFPCVLFLGHALAWSLSMWLAVGYVGEEGFPGKLLIAWPTEEEE